MKQPNIVKENVHKYSVAPMLDVSNRYFWVLIRMLSKEATLYTEMIHCDTVLKCKDREGLLSFDLVEKPVVF